MGADCFSSTRTHKFRQKEILFQVNNSNLGQSKNNYQNIKTPIQLDFTLINVTPNNKYKIQVSTPESNNPFTTESIISSNNNIIPFNKSYISDYFFERHQYLNITLIKNGVNYGYIKTPLGLIVGSPKSTYETEIGNDKEYIMIRAQGLSDTNSYIEFIFSAQNLNSDFSDIKNKIYFKILDKFEKSKYLSESISSSGKFDHIKIPLALLEPNFTIQFCDSKDETLFYKQETPDSFTNNNPNKFYVGFNLNNSRINIINNSTIYRHFTFLDYLKSGVTIKLTIGIDFTSSNLPPDNPKSFHYLYGGMNDYELAIRACGPIVAYYDYNQSFPVYGFGAVIKGHNAVSDCFNINFKKNPEIKTIDNVINEYHKCFHNIILAGPTRFCPLIEKVNETIRKENNKFRYHILMIITDGII